MNENETVSETGIPNTFDILKSAIETKKCISFEYEAENRAIGVRFGDPHAIYIATSNNVNMHIWKTGGVSTDDAKIIPAWRAYKVENIMNVKILKELPCFNIADGYVPNSTMYDKVIVKI